MFQMMVLLLDGSEQAERALPLAAQMARAGDGRLVLLYMLPAPERTAEAETYLEGLLQRHPLAGVEVERRLSRAVEAPALLAAVQAIHADLLFLCQTRLAHWKPEWVVQQAVCRARIPLLWLPERARPLLVGAPVRVLVPLDGSRLAETALAPALSLAAALAAPRQGALHLARVISGLAQQRKAAAYLRVVARRLRQSTLARGVPLISWSVVNHLDVAEGLRRVAEQGEDAERLESWSVARDLPAPFARCDLVALTTHCRQKLARWTLGSVIERLIKWERCALLIMPPPGAAEEAAPTAGEITEAELHAWLGIS